MGKAWTFEAYVTKCYEEAPETRVEQKTANLIIICSETKWNYSYLSIYFREFLGCTV